MRWIAVVALLLTCTGCSGPGPSERHDGSVVLITRPEGQDDSTWEQDRGHLRVESGCILFKGQLVVFPHDTRLVDGGTALALDEDAVALPLDGTAEVAVTGSEVPLGTAGDWEHAMDAANLERWSDCRRRAGISEYADWWQVVSVDLVSASRG